VGLFFRQEVRWRLFEGALSELVWRVPAHARLLQMIQVEFSRLASPQSISSSNLERYAFKTRTFPQIFPRTFPRTIFFSRFLLVFPTFDVDSCLSHQIQLLTDDNQQMQCTVTQLEKEQRALMEELTLFRDENNHLHKQIGVSVISVSCVFFLSHFCSFWLSFFRLGLFLVSNSLW
jgi:hypothetical protein